MASPLSVPPPAKIEPPTTASLDWEVVVAGAQTAEPQGTMAPVVRDSFTATTEAELRARRRAEARAAQVSEAAIAARQAVRYNMVEVTPIPVDVPPQSFSGAAVFNAAQSYLGVPYVFGGTTRDGMDCSGLVLTVFSQFGIVLPHSAGAQAARGTRVAESQAQLGDLVVIPGHIGFWAGPGMILEAARPGTNVRIHTIWSSSYYIVRLA